MTEAEFSKITTLHELLAVAIADTQQFRQRPGHLLDMYCWLADRFMPDAPNGMVCTACLAGAVMYESLGIVSMACALDMVVPNKAIQYRLSAIDSLRSGDLRLAMDYLTAAVAGRWLRTPLRELPVDYQARMPRIPEAMQPEGVADGPVVERFFAQLDRLHYWLKMHNL